MLFPLIRLVSQIILLISCVVGLCFAFVVAPIAVPVFFVGLFSMQVIDSFENVFKIKDALNYLKTDIECELEDGCYVIVFWFWAFSTAVQSALIYCDLNNILFADVFYYI